MLAQRPDLRFAALFLWIRPRFAILSSIFCTSGYFARAAVLSVIERRLRTAERIFLP